MIRHEIEMLLSQLKSNVTASQSGHPMGGSYAEIPEWQLCRWLDELDGITISLVLCKGELFYQRGSETITTVYPSSVEEAKKEAERLGVEWCEQ